MANKLERCKYCGAKYELIEVKLPFAEKDSLNCKKCGHELIAWDGTLSFVYPVNKVKRFFIYLLLFLTVHFIISNTALIEQPIAISTFNFVVVVWLLMVISELIMWLHKIIKRFLSADNEMQYKVGSCVVYPTHGVGKIVAEEIKKIDEIELRLLVINFEKDKMTLRVPRNRAIAAGLRPINPPTAKKKTIDWAWFGKVFLALFVIGVGITYYEKYTKSESAQTGKQDLVADLVSLSLDIL